MICEMGGVVKRIARLTIALVLILQTVGYTAVSAIDGETIYAGTAGSFSSSDDSYIGRIPFNFTFEYFGNQYTDAYITTNGLINFSSGTSAYSNTSTGYTNSIDAFWDDLILSTGSKIYYTTVGVEGSRKFIVQWTNMYFYGTSITMGTFQAILYEGSNNVQLQFRDLLGGSRSLGNSATIGLVSSSSNLIYSYNTESISEGQAILYTPDGEGSYTVDDTASYDLVYLQATDAPDSPSLINPLDGTTDTTVTPTFEWQASARATSYNILISTVSDFSSLVVNETGLTETSYTLGSPLSYDTTYYWRIAAVNSYGTNLSSSRTFTTSGVPNDIPDIPSNVSSSKMIGSNQTNLDGSSLSMTLADNDEDQQVRYRIQIASEDTFSSPVIDYRSEFGAQGTHQYQFGQSEGAYLTGDESTSLEDGDYYIRIRAEDASAASSDWYEVSGVAFTYDNTDPDPVDGLAADTESSPKSTVVSWNASNEPNLGTPSYKIQYSSSENFTSAQTTTSSLSSINISNLSYGNWYVRVSVLDQAGNYSTYSSTLTINIPEPVQQDEPEDSAPQEDTPNQNTVETPVTITSSRASVATSTEAPSTPTTNQTYTPTEAAETEQEDIAEENEIEQVQTETKQTKTVVILVLDDNGNPVEGAKVTLHSTPRVGYTNSEGKAIFYDVELGEHKMFVDYGSETYEQPLILAEQNNDSQDTQESITVRLASNVQQKNNSNLWSPVTLTTIALAFIILVILTIIIAKDNRRKQQ